MDNSVYKPPETGLILESTLETNENMFQVVLLKNSFGDLLEL
jgi:hypothetical protein